MLPLARVAVQLPDAPFNGGVLASQLVAVVGVAVVGAGADGADEAAHTAAVRVPLLQEATRCRL